VRRQAAGSKTRPAAGLAHQQNAVGQPAGPQGGAQVLFQGVVAGQAGQHPGGLFGTHSFSNRSTLVTKTVAPPTVTSMGMALSSPSPMEAAPGTISVRCLQHLEMQAMQSSTRSS